MLKIKFIYNDNSDEIETIQSSIIPRIGDIVVINKGKFLVHGVTVGYVTNEIIVYCI